MRPYLIVAFALAAFAGGAYGRGLVGVLGTYAITGLAGLVTCVGFTRWEQRDWDARSRRR